MALVVEVSAWVPHSSQAACQSNFSKNVQTPRRGARAWLCPAPCAGCRAPRRGRAVAPGRARAPRGRAGLPGWRVTSSICNPHGRTAESRWPDGAGAGSQGGVQWPGTLSTMAVASRARELLGLALLSAAAVRGRGKGCGCHTRQRARLFVADIRASHVLARSRENETSYILVGRRRTLGPPWGGWGGA